MDLRVLFEDDSIIVFDKPAGLVVTSTETHNKKTLEDILKEDYKIEIDRGGVVHRLDKDTSGVIVVAKTQEALENLQDQFKQREAKKEYLALVHGTISGSGKIEGAILRNPENREKFIVSEDSEEGREAVTEYEPRKTWHLNNQSTLKKWFPEFNNIQIRKLERMNYGEFTLVLCKPLTGRTHQIRVHLKHIGFGIVGDEKYAGRKISRVDNRWCKRQFLHAKCLRLKHPKTREILDFESPLAEDLKTSINILNGSFE